MCRFFGFVLSLALVTSITAQDVPLRTVAEKSNYEATSTSADVIQYCLALAKKYPDVVEYTTCGKSGNGQDIPVLILKSREGIDPKSTKKTSIVVKANIHAGEVDGKEAVLALARDLAADPETPILDSLTVVIVPNFNPDGNDAFSEKNRTTQNGPKSVGTRENAEKYDLNRDYIKMETPEVRAIVRLIEEWDPLMVIDCHTTNGSYHRYTLTYDGPRHPAADPKLIDYALQKLQPAVTKLVKDEAKYDIFTYGDFTRDHKQWVTYPCLPRYGTQTLGIKGYLSVLSESYSYAPYKDRVLVSYAFVKANLTAMAEDLSAVSKIIRAAKKPRKTVALRSKTIARDKPMSVFGYVEELKNGRMTRTDETKDYECEILDKVVPALETTLPKAYVFPAEYTLAADALRRHGIEVQELREEIEVDVEQYTITDLKKANREFQRHQLVTLEGEAKKKTVRLRPGMFVVPMNQKLANFAAFLLEPMSEDGLATWNFFDAGVSKGQAFPVLRLETDTPLLTGNLRDLPEDREVDLPFTIDMLRGGGQGRARSRSGRTTSFGSVTWLDDGEHYLQTKNYELWKVHARTGRATIFVNSKLIEKSVEEIPLKIGQELNAQIQSGSYRWASNYKSVLISSSQGYILANVDGTPGKVLLKNRRVEFAKLSEDVKYLSFIEKGNLFTVDTNTGKVSQHTSDGGKNDILNGRADWVYEEEIFSRNGQAYWWSPDNQQIAFMKFDDAKVPKFYLTDLSTPNGTLETINYPKPGDPNPIVSIGVATVGPEAATKFLNLEGYPADDLVISRVGWIPGDKPMPFAYLQNREQTWLDFVYWPTIDGKPTKIFRETTKAWVEDLGEPHWLDDGSFLILSERSGWKHIYRYQRTGELMATITAGPWEVKSIVRVDKGSGDIYFMASKVRHTATHLCLVTLGDDTVQVISHEQPTHSIQMAPKGSLYIDRFTDDNTPSQAILRELFVKPIRILDTNPSYEREKYRYGRYERKQIKMNDGFELEAAITYPPDFHEYNRYPIWIMTYAGPHAPTIREGWSMRTMENILAAQGVIVFRVDPRSASGKGAESAWTCYQQLGVQELKDLEEAIDWIGQNSWADTSRVGISGHSYGGFMASYALTHSKKFAAGIAGAPVTDWGLYDSIYTERYMKQPKNNQDGYDKTSAVKAAKNLNGKLLIVHGVIDDNVHMQNSLKLSNQLQAAGKDFEMMMYMNSRHGIGSSHYPIGQVKFILKVFGLEK